MRLVWTRTVVAGFWMLTAIYCLISAIPFTWEQFLKWHYVPALTAFAAWHPWISLAVLAAAGVGLAPWLRTGHRGARAFMVGWGAAAVAMLIAPPLSKLQPSATAFVLTLLSLVPPVWISLLKLPLARPAATAPLDGPADDLFRDIAACWLSALVVTLIYAITALPLVLRFGARSAGVQLLRSLLLHLVVFSAVFATLCVIRGAARLISKRSGTEEVLARCTLAFAFALFILRIVLRPLSLVGPPAAILAAGLGAGLATTLAPRATRAPPGLDQALSGLVPAWATRSAPAAVGWLAGVAFAILAAVRAVAVSDWNFTIAKFIAVMSWLLVFAAVLRVIPGRPRRPSLVPFVACLAILGVHQAASRAAGGSADVGDAWMQRDPSVRLIADALAPKALISDEGLGDFLQLHTNIPHSTKIDPVPIDLAPLEGPPSANRPDIYLFVIDSLRRDYLSPYNREVGFTPAFGQFARESTVFERAFTRYGATGLSVPALWIGGLMLHKQYVTPFGPMNTLAKLLEHEQYEQWIAMDAILDVILPASQRRTPLEATTGARDDRFCSAVAQIRRRLDARKTGGPPVFAYALPQDIHVSTIAREGATPVDGESYGAFYAPYASRLRRMDACFGQFIADLKERGLFDRSLIIVTADHGDSLGEQGRIGHAYTIFPEIVQVPLIVHLPSDLRATLRTDPSAPAFNIDITPTLYALLGHEPRQPAPFFGRPLFRSASAAPPRSSTEPVMVASSYGSVYGALLNDARRLYILDGVGFREYAYDLDGTGPGRVSTVTPDDRERSQRAIRETVEGIARFYGYHPDARRHQ